MKLHDHPLLSFAGHHSWPPVWTWIGGDRDKYLTGEIGVLKEVRTPPSSPPLPMKCFLVIEHENSLYMGCMFIGDYVFGRQLSVLLQARRGQNIQDIGSLDVGHLL